MVKIPGIAPAHIMYRPQARSHPPWLESLVTRSLPIQESQKKTFSHLLMGRAHVYTLPYCRFSQERWGTPIGTHVLYMRASNLRGKHNFEGPTMPYQLYKESLPFD